MGMFKLRSNKTHVLSLVFIKNQANFCDHYQINSEIVCFCKYF